MATDRVTFATRLRALLPKGWFSDDGPILGALLNCIAAAWGGLSSNLDYVICQTRIQTATDIWLDVIGVDFLGTAVCRQPHESDDSFRNRIRSHLLTPAATRRSIVEGVAKLTNATALVFEPSRCSDTGAYGDSTATAQASCRGLAYGVVGGWGSLNLPYQTFITIKTKPLPGEPSPTGYGIPGGGYSAGSLSYNELATVPGRLTDDDIRRAILRLLPANCTAWLRFS